MSSGASRAWRPTLGAIPGPKGTTFRAWAPRPRDVSLFIDNGTTEQILALEATRDGCREITIAGVGAGARYGFVLDGEGPFPDPCSRSQPDGVHGLSAVVDPSLFAWTDSGWRRPPFRELVIYECHIGTLTAEGTFAAALEVLPGLKAMGITAIEIMPVAAFPGRWNWGYDGVALFAPCDVYGGPDGLRRLVDGAHAVGMAVILDVVFNHFGPDGNYTGRFSEQYTTARYRAPWGAAVNFDGPGSEQVRRFFRENLLHWLAEYHIDGFRFDATHAIFDASPTHVLAELAEAAEAAGGAAGKPYLIAESHENDVRYVTARSLGGFGFDGVWADDFHHAVRTMLLGERDGYLRGFDGRLSTLARTIRHGFFFEGQFDEGFGGHRGTRAREVPWSSFVYCIQNHDQVGNRAFGQRLNAGASHADFLAATVLLLLLPQVPLLFQGQECLSTRPFQYFTDHEGELGVAVSEGRRHEFAAFRAFSSPLTQAAIPDPQDERTFRRSVLDSDDGDYGEGKLARELHTAVLALRSEDLVFRAYRESRLPIATRTQGRCLVLDFACASGRRRVVANFGQRVNVSLPGGTGASILLQSNDGRFGGNGVETVLHDGQISVPAHATVVLAG